MARTASSIRFLIVIALASVFAHAATPLPASGQGFLDQFQNNSFGGSAGFGANADEPVSVSSQFTPATADRPAVLMVTAKIGPGWHVYSQEQGKLPSGLGPQKTTLKLAESPEYRLLGGFREFPLPHERLDTVVFEGLMLKEHENKVTWYAPIAFADGVDPASATVNAKLDLQACHDQQGCVPQSFEITAQLGDGVPIGELDTTAPSAIAATPDPSSPSPTPPSKSVTPAELAAAGAAAEPYKLSEVRFPEQPGSDSLLRNLVLAFGGGLILNLMPCVLPVIGLKVMSFVQQAGFSRAKAFELNLWYSLGIISVFWILGLLAIFAGLSWGKQFSSVGFNLVMASIVFAMALSLLGVWEIHVPSVVGRGSTHQAVAGEGRSAAYFKGVLTTMLATPCTGPGMAVALGWAVRQSGPTIMLVFTVLGLGMAFPYLLIGAFPKLVNFLPRPGEWMVTFKQLMGFVLLSTVIFLLSLVPSNYLLPSLCLLTSIGLACWVYSKMQIGAPIGEHTQTIALSGAIVAAGAVFAFAWLAPVLSDESEEWQAFSLAKLNQVAVEEGKTVLVDFGADWCANCQVLEKTVLHTPPVEQAIKTNRIVTMFADNTKYPPEIEQTLKALRSNGVPVIAIFPGGAPYEPIVFRGIYTQGDLTAAIEEAKTRKPTSVASSTPDRPIATAAH
ncbi:Thiol:disulfide interchange protein DsbD precursor [Posidoniimonas polymericola]|uniref:Thiol:disulfide interchange protein DsbD n=1 Tax=Posidoniimonas polymericola TaxID=2528002 RepID=A0A5C5XXS5_9BACT|nr:thioredoxin family protein [Posidoniimonas polymericola]TWT67740.1 Thiol:disulfide interchange protein DsbD precursor [Posidoniimonas polymericola]